MLGAYHEGVGEQRFQGFKEFKGSKGSTGAPPTSSPASSVRADLHVARAASATDGDLLPEARQPQSGKQAQTDIRNIYRWHLAVGRKPRELTKRVRPR